MQTSSAQSSLQDENVDPVVNLTKSIFDRHGNIIITGETSKKNAYIAQINSAGKVLWQENFGGNDSEVVEGLAIDSNNHILVVGRTWSNNFPTTENAVQTEFGGIYDLFVRKWDDRGNPIWSTYLGGSGTECPAWQDDGLIVVEDNNLIISGLSGSRDGFPLEAAYQTQMMGGKTSSDQSRCQDFDYDPFFMKLSSNGELIWSTFLGGSAVDGSFTYVDNNHNVLAIGGGNSIDYPTTPDAFMENAWGVSDGYISKIASNGSLMWSTYSGGSLDDGYSWDTGIIDAENNVYQIMGLRSPDHPAATLSSAQTNLGGSFDLFITKFNPSGDLDWGTYWGGSSHEIANTFCCVDETNDFLYQNLVVRKVFDRENNLVISGRTASTNFPTQNGFQPSSSLDFANPAMDMFVSKFSSHGQVIFSSYLGGSDIENVGDIFVTSDNSIVVTGSTFSTDMPFSGKATFQSAHAGSEDVFVAKISETGEMTWSSYLGGSGSDKLIFSKMDQNHNTYLIGQTTSEDFPGIIASGSYQGGQDGFISKIDPEGNLQWTRLIGGSGNEVFNIYSMQISQEGQVLIMGSSFSNDAPIPPSPAGGGSYSFIVSLDTNGDLNWNRLLGEYSENRSPEDYTMIIIVVGIFLVSGGIIGGFRFRRAEKVILNQKMAEILSPVFNSRSSLVYLLIGQSVTGDKEYEQGLKKKIPTEIFDFKDLFHPIRLAITTLLYENTNMTSIELRDELDVPWTEMTYHLNTLKKKKYAYIEQHFIDDAIRLVVTPSPLLLEKFKQLRGLLHDMLDRSPNLDRYLEAALEVRQESGEGLYPTGN